MSQGDELVEAALSRAEHELLCAFGQGYEAGRKGGYLADNPHPWESAAWQAWRTGFQTSTDG